MITRSVRIILKTYKIVTPADLSGNTHMFSLIFATYHRLTNPCRFFSTSNFALQQINVSVQSASTVEDGQHERTVTTSEEISSDDIVAMEIPTTEES